jgi:general secretion pathway protein L
MNYLVVQLSRQEAVVARFARRRGELVFIEAARHALGGAHELPALLEGLAPAAGEERVILALPPSLLFLRELDLPIADRRRLREVVPLELTGETALESDELVFDALPLADGKALALWVRQREAAERIRLLVEQKLEPEIATFSPCHWQTLLPPAERAGTVALTDGEALAVFRDGGLLFCRPLASGEMAAEVGRTLAILELAKGVTVPRLLLHGEAARRHEPAGDDAGGAVDPLPLPVEGELAAAFAGDEASARDLAGAYAVAAAVHLGEAVNFRSGPLAYTAGRARTRRRLRLTIGLAATAVLLLLGEAGFRYYLVQRDLVSLDRSIAAIYREVFPTRKKAVDEVGELRSEIKRLGSGAAGSSVLPLLKKVAEAKGDDVTGIFEAEIEGDQVRLKGDARSIQAVNDFKTRAVGLFTTAEVGEIKSRPDGSVSFVFRGTATEGKK